MSAEKKETAGVIAPPPLVYAAGLVPGWLLERRWPSPYGLIEPLAQWIGWSLIAVGVVVLVWALIALRRVRTSVNPYTPSTAIATTGPYRWSRNPIYVADLVIYLGVCALLNSLWPLLFLPAVIWIVNKGVIEREERYLENRFGNLYTVYKSRVRRWL
ncbi:MAG TPA: isoprenylcysteine carboxylmethyltransferase family protein [Burkholderiales bacterium]|nr:isoprenylcysteine carboxylmethyltransferase family protein [Burkholderiales bacterium]